MYVSEHHGDWDLFIPYALFAYRTAVQSSTNETPFYLRYGRDPRLPIDVSLTKAQETYCNTDDYRGIIAGRFLDAWKLTRDNIELAQQRQKSQYDKTAKDVTYDIGTGLVIHHLITERVSPLNSQLARPISYTGKEISSKLPPRY